MDPQGTHYHTCSIAAILAGVPLTSLWNITSRQIVPQDFTSRSLSKVFHIGMYPLHGTVLLSGLSESISAIGANLTSLAATAARRGMPFWRTLAMSSRACLSCMSWNAGSRYLTIEEPLCFLMLIGRKRSELCAMALQGP